MMDDLKSDKCVIELGKYPESSEVKHHNKNVAFHEACKIVPSNNEEISAICANWKIFMINYVKECWANLS